MTTLASWDQVKKHQVSPQSHPKALLKLVRKDGKSLTCEFTSREELDRIRQEITARLRSRNSVSAPSKKRRQSEIALPMKKSVTFDQRDPTSMAVTRSSLLAANPTLREQHRHLVTETKTVSEDDFWMTHKNLIEEEYAKICGTTRAGTSSLLQSHLPLQGRVTLGVEEMRQIFILYPAVHKAYEEKVPLELSDEQFWRKYLESEYFHRDRGRLGTAARNQHGIAKKKHKTASGKTIEEEDARAAAVGTDDFFARYDAKIRGESKGGDASARKYGTKLAVGQFDLASTLATERGHLLEGPKDCHPPNIADDSRGASVIKKYNRHWAMVLHPDEAVAGSDLMDISSKSTDFAIKNDQDAKANGGVAEEMYQLVGYANASAEDANHVLGLGGNEDAGYEELTLNNVEAYLGQEQRKINPNESPADLLKKQAFFAQQMSNKIQQMARPFRDHKEMTKEDPFPNPTLGRQLLGALTNKMDMDSRSDAETLEVTNTLTEDFKKRLHTYFRRVSELLRHFFGLRRLETTISGQNAKKLARIVKAMEAVYREMEAIRKEMPQTEGGEVMRKMYLPIMDQLDRAFQLHRDGSGMGGGGGFVDVEEL